MPGSDLPVPQIITFSLALIAQAPVIMKNTLTDVTEKPLNTNSGNLGGLAPISAGGAGKALPV